ncbi:MAG: YlxM family DNA-binding protein [Firmicutes bacterium]|nr:YlxM family DNA-binding protein [Bacillota bacterium]
MEHFIRVYQLFSFYGQLLTEKQRLAVEWYFGHDLSLAEIASELGISRQAVHDLLKRAEQTLTAYEEKLGLAESYARRQEQLAKLDQLLKQLRDDEADPRWQQVFALLAELSK